MNQTAIIHVVDDDDAQRRSIVFLAESVGWRARSYDSAESFLRAVRPGEPGCAILDIRMPAMSGLELQREMVARGAGLPVIFVTGHADVGLAVEAMKGGAIDFLEKPFRDQTLLDAIAKAVRHNLASQASHERHEVLAQLLAGLTPRERDVAALVARGQPNKIIARTLGISEKTVHIHRSRVMEKTATHSAAELARLMMQVDPAFGDDPASGDAAGLP